MTQFPNLRGFYSKLSVLLVLPSVKRQSLGSTQTLQVVNKHEITGSSGHGLTCFESLMSLDPETYFLEAHVRL